MLQKTSALFSGLGFVALGAFILSACSDTIDSTKSPGDIACVPSITATGFGDECGDSNRETQFSEADAGFGSEEDAEPLRPGVAEADARAEPEEDSSISGDAQLGFDLQDPQYEEPQSSAEQGTPRQLCPDRAEANDERMSAFPLSLSSGCSEPVVSEVGGTGLGDCARNPCLCGSALNLAACGPDDPDYHSVDLVIGDQAWLIVDFEEPVVPNHDVTIIGTDPNGLFISNYEWLFEGGESARRFIAAVPAAIPAQDSGRAVGTYTVAVLSNEGQHEYDVSAASRSQGRDCIGDPWDAEFEDYRASDPSEQTCRRAECTLGDEEVAGQLCQWDHQDVFRYQTTTEQRVRFRVEWDNPVVRSLRARLFHDDESCVESGCPIAEREAKVGVPFTLESETLTLAPGIYQVAVSGDLPTAFRVRALQADE